MNSDPNSTRLMVTPRATKLVTSHFKNKTRSPVRIFVHLGGCGIRIFGVAIEPAKPSDAVFEVDGFTYIINKKLLGLLEPVILDSDGLSFLLTSDGKAPAQACGNCGQMCNIRGDNRCNGNCRGCRLQCGYGQQQLLKA